MKVALLQGDRVHLDLTQWTPDTSRPSLANNPNNHDRVGLNGDPGRFHYPDLLGSPHHWCLPLRTRGILT
jgi:hypothetical protein